MPTITARSTRRSLPITIPTAPRLQTRCPRRPWNAVGHGPRCWAERLTLDIVFTDIDARYRLELRNGVLTHSAAPQARDADALVRLPRAALPALATGTVDLGDAAAHGITVEGDPAVIGRLLAA